MTDGRQCPVCGGTDLERTDVESAVPWKHDGELEDRTHADCANWIECKSCGEFVVTHLDDVNLKNSRDQSKWNPAHLSALVREQSIRRHLPRFWLRDGMDPYGPLHCDNLAPIDVDELLTRWPRTVADRIGRTLCNMATLSPTAGHRVTVNAHDTALLFADTVEEARYHINALTDAGFLSGQLYVNSLAGSFVITPHGWSQVDQLTRGRNAPENPAFVAMWFGGETDTAAMEDAFRNGIAKAIVDAGYHVTRVDLTEHNDWIMDKVLGDIRLAPFVVADFTAHRNGVYFEAGFARGLGTPVIHTCRKGDFQNAHFDTVQLNHILWDTPADLAIKLYNRILGTMGQGPYWRGPQQG